MTSLMISAKVVVLASSSLPWAVNTAMFATADGGVVIVGDLAGVIRPEISRGVLILFRCVMLVLSDVCVFKGVLVVSVVKNRLSLPPWGPACWQDNLGISWKGN